VQTWAEARPSLPLPICTVAVCHQALSLRRGWHGQGGEDGKAGRSWRADHVAARFPVWHLHRVMAAVGELALCRGMAKSKSKENFCLCVRCQGSAALWGQPNDYSLLSLLKVRE